MTPDRPQILPAVTPPENRKPERIILPLPDGYETSIYLHKPPAEFSPKSPILFCHGIQSHPGWFFGSALALAAAGHPVYQITRRGNGDNTIARGHAKSPRQLFDDLQATHQFITHHCEVEKIHLMGVSWGGKLLAAYLADKPERQNKVASLTMLAPGIAAKVDVTLSTKLAIAAALFTCPKKLFDIPLNDPELFTQNPAMIDYLQKDKLRLHKATAKFLYTSKQIDKLLAKSGGVITCPSNLILSETDHIIDNAGCEKIVANLTGGKANVITLPGQHTQDFEPSPNNFYETLISVLEN